MSDERITEAEIAELPAWVRTVRDALATENPRWLPAPESVRIAVRKVADGLDFMLSERLEREGKLAEADAGWTDAETRCAMEGAQRHHAEEKLAEAEQRATNWEDDAQRYAQNSDYWKKRAEAAEATLARVRELPDKLLAKRDGITKRDQLSLGLRRAYEHVAAMLREALTTPVVSDRPNVIERPQRIDILVGDSNLGWIEQESPELPWCWFYFPARGKPAEGTAGTKAAAIDALLSAESDRLAPVSHQEDTQ